MNTALNFATHPLCGALADRSVMFFVSRQKMNIRPGRRTHQTGTTRKQIERRMYDIEQ